MPGRDAPGSRADAVPTRLGLFLIFTRIGLTSFGGGLSGWLMRAFVQDRNWLSEEDFINGLSLSQALPGVNVTNMAIWIGYRLLGLSGAVASLLGMVVPAAVTIIAIAAVFARLSPYPVTHLVLDGAAAAAVGLSLSMGLTVARRVRRDILPLAVLAGCFVSVGVLHWPIIWVVLGGGAFSIAAEYVRLRRAPPST